MNEIRNRTRYKGFSIKTITRNGIISQVCFLGKHRFVNARMSLEEAISEAKDEIDAFINDNYKEFDDDEIVSLMEVYRHCRMMRRHIINQIRS